MGLLHRLRREAPDKEFYIISNSLVCPNMEDHPGQYLDTMRLKRNMVTVPEDIRVKAKRAVDRMLEIV